MSGRQTDATIDWLDRLALTGSVLCMVHCLALPLVIAALPALASVVSVPESFHRWVLALAVPAAAIALGQGRARHGADVPSIVGGGGVVLLAVGALVMPEGGWETATTVAGSVSLGWAHVANWRLRRSCGA